MTAQGSRNAQGWNLTQRPEGDQAVLIPQSRRQRGGHKPSQAPKCVLHSLQRGEKNKKQKL